MNEMSLIEWAELHGYVKVGCPNCGLCDWSDSGLPNCGCEQEEVNE